MRPPRHRRSSEPRRDGIAEAVTISTSACPISRKIIIVLLTAAALTTGLIANAFAFSGGVSHPVSHPACMAAGTATGLGTDVRHHRRRHHVAAQVRPRPHH